MPERGFIQADFSIVHDDREAELTGPQAGQKNRKTRAGKQEPNRREPESGPGNHERLLLELIKQFIKATMSKLTLGIALL